MHGRVATELRPSYWLEQPVMKLLVVRGNSFTLAASADPVIIRLDTSERKGGRRAGGSGEAVVERRW